jgi:hypothetical protein
MHHDFDDAGDVLFELLGGEAVDVAAVLADALFQTCAFALAVLTSIAESKILPISIERYQPPQQPLSGLVRLGRSLRSHASVTACSHGVL